MPTQASSGLVCLPDQFLDRDPKCGSVRSVDSPHEVTETGEHLDHLGITAFASSIARESSRPPPPFRKRSDSLLRTLGLSGSIVPMPAEEKVARYDELAVRLVGLASERSRLVAIDGPGGAGKSFFAQRLSKALGNAPVVQTDDFATGEPGVEWWPRLQSEVIEPLLSGHAARYQRFDWNRRALAEWRGVPTAPVVIIEGVSSARRELAPHLALAVWIHAPRPVRLARGLERDGEAARLAWERWMAEEDAHFRADETVARCDVFVDGSPMKPHDSEREFVQLSE
jgi:hypothetical protein